MSILWSSVSGWPDESFAWQYPSRLMTQVVERLPNDSDDALPNHVPQHSMSLVPVNRSKVVRDGDASPHRLPLPFRRPF